jgi:hypothetical protein
MMRHSQIGAVLAGGTLMLFFILPQAGKGLFAADLNKGTSNTSNTNAQHKGVPGKAAKGLPCDIPEGQNVTRATQDAKRGSHVIFGEVLHVDGATYLIKEESGKEVNVQADQTTEKPPINQGDHISANIDNQNHALWIRANRGSDRRTEHASADCNPKEN